MEHLQKMVSDSCFRRTLWVFCLLVFVIYSSCRTNERAEVDDSDDTATQTEEHEVSGVDQANDLNPIEAQTMVDDVTIGKKVGSDGMVAAEGQADDFAPGDSIYLTLKVADAPAGSEVKVYWYGPGKDKLKEETKSVPSGSQYLNFEATDTASWSKGDYRAEVWIGDEKVNQQQFQIVDSAEAGNGDHEMPPEDGPDTGKPPHSGAPPPP